MLSRIGYEWWARFVVARHVEYHTRSCVPSASGCHLRAYRLRESERERERERERACFSILGISGARASCHFLILGRFRQLRHLGASGADEVVGGEVAQCPPVPRPKPSARLGCLELDEERLRAEGRVQYTRLPPCTKLRGWSFGVLI